MLLTERQIRDIIREEIVREATTTPAASRPKEKVYVDNQGYKFVIRNKVLTLIARPPAMGNAGLPKPVPAKMRPETIENLAKRYKDDPGIKSLTNAATSPAPVPAPSPVGQSDISGVSMYGAKVGDAKNYIDYRVYSNGMIKRFGVMKGGRWTMDDPAKEIPADQRAAIAKNILSANQYDYAAKSTLSAVASGKLAGTGGSEGGVMQKILSTMRRTLLTAGAPISFVAFADYLMGRTSTWTANDLPSNYHADLAKVAKYALTRASPRTKKKGEILHDDVFVYNDFWRNASIKLGQGKPGSPIGGGGPIGTGTVEAFSFFLGGMVVTQEGQEYVIRDIYDFDDYFVSPQAYDEMMEFMGSVAKATTPYQFIRKAASFRQSTGYTGFPVEIRLPVSLAADFKV